ncbi:MAG: STAS domain-containing protein [Candidatus Omnitrophota bacterium]
MKIIEAGKEDSLTLFLEGNFDETTSPEVEMKIDAIISENFNNIFLDLGKVKYISSAGIRVLLLAYKKSVKAGKKVSLVNISGKAHEVLDMVGILPLFTENKGHC